MGESTFVAQSPERNVVFRWVAISAVLIITLAALRHGASQQRKSSNASNTNTKVAKSTYEWKVEQAAPKFEGKLEDVYLEMLCGTTPFQLHAQIALNTDQKLTIVAIHGVENGSNMTFWEPSLGTMTSLGRMARLDLPGFGSSKLPLSGADPRVHHRAIARLVEATEALENKNTKILFFARAWSAVPLLQYLEKSSNSKTLRNKVAGVVLIAPEIVKSQVSAQVSNYETLLVWAAKDPVLPSWYSQKLLPLFKNVELAVVPDLTSHTPEVHAVDAFHNLLQKWISLKKIQG